MDHYPDPSKPLIIGVGNRLRGDDAIGPLVVDVVRERFGDRYLTRVADGDLSDLLLYWHQDQDVAIVDAMVSGRAVGDVFEFGAMEDQLPIEAGLLSSHGVGLAEAIELARMLGRLPRRLTIIAVEGSSFGHFEEPTAAVSASIDQVVERLGKLFEGESADA